MMYIKAITLVAFSVAFLIANSRVDGLKCWVCNSIFDPFCKDPFDNTTANHKHCTGDEDAPSHLKGVPVTMCRKIRMKIYGHWRYVRDCARLGEPGLGGDERYCLYRSGTYNIHMEYCTCNDKENCNGAHTFAWSKPLLITSIFVAVCARLFYL